MSLIKDKSSTSKNKPDESAKSDLALLFGSETRALVIWTLLNNPDWGFTQAEIARDTGRDPKDVHRSLETLVQLSIVIVLSSPDGPQTSISPYTPDGRFDPEKAEELDIEIRIRTHGYTKRYWLNKEHPWVQGLRIILENSSLGAINLIKKELKAFPPEKLKPDIAFVYGSFATGGQTPESDIDLIVIGYHDRDTLAEMMNKLEERVSRAINYVEYLPEEWASALKDDNDFARTIKAKPKIFLIGNNEILERIS